MTDEGATSAVPIMHELAFVPDYRLFSVRDDQSDAAVGVVEAVAETDRVIAVSTDYAVYIRCAQDRLRTLVRLEFWDAPARDNDEGWNTLPSHLIVCPSGYLRLGDDTGTALGELRHPSGGGSYRVVVSHRGRVEAIAALWSIDTRQELTLPERLEAYRNNGEIEQYRIRMWREGPLPDDGE